MEPEVQEWQLISRFKDSLLQRLIQCVIVEYFI